MGQVQRLQVMIHGRVQGVGFRNFAIHRASELGLVGYVKNRWDGTVEVVAEGERTTLEQLLGHVRRGPRAATIAKVDVTWLPATGEFDEFGARFF